MSRAGQARRGSIPPMGAIINIPSELAEFLGGGTTQSLLLRGAPGTGKTSLSLALLEWYPGEKIYLTNRMGEEEFHRQFPWLRSRSGAQGIQIIDSSHDFVRLNDTARVMARAHELLSDADGSASTEGLWLPAPILEVLSRVRPGIPAMLVVDSWDALVESYVGSAIAPPNPDRGEIERVLLRQLQASRISAVLVLEREEQSQLDYLVNGVVRTGQRLFENRTERWLELKKLRGIRISSPSYPYTLEGGRFQAIAPASASGRIRSLAPSEPDPVPAVPGRLWPGTSGFAQWFGRLDIGALTLFLVDGTVEDADTRAFLAPMAAQVILEGGRVGMIPPPGTPPATWWNEFRTLRRPEEIEPHLRIQLTSPGPVAKPEVGPVLLPLSAGRVAAGSPQCPGLYEFLAHRPHREAPALVLAWTSGTRAVGVAAGMPYTPESLPAIVAGYLHEARVHMVFIGAADDPLMECLRPMAAVQFRGHSRAGRLFVYGIRPETPLLVVTAGDATAPYRLLPVV
ncbi:MAG: RAD55 family ATPase [Thermoplasmata archaeon]